MISNLSIKAQTAIEALGNSPDSIDLELLGIEPLKNILPAFKYAIEANSINDSCRLVEIFGLDTNFFYIIESVHDNKVCGYERGIGSIYIKNDKYFLNRKRIFVYGNNSLECAVSTDNVPKSFCCNCDTYIYSSIPPTYLESLSVDNSVLCSSMSCLPHPVGMTEDSLLARMSDKIESVSFKDDRLVSKIINAITTFGKQLKLKTSKLSLKRVEPEIIDMVPTSNVKAKRGSLYYDESDNKLKLYDGQSWKTIMFLED